ncbi:hypothetical protein NFI08_10115 [Halomonas sp. EF61]|uniref:DUF6538 domain-containing protein n=1 Tax=Halomonas sp. EF61 TaxID=2950869 RepID=UPI0032DEB7F0
MPGSVRPVARKTLPSCNICTPSKRSSARRPSAPYLFRSRHGIWYFRVVVPERARQAIGKTEIRRSLGTRCRREAMVAAAALLLESHELLTRHAANEGDDKACGGVVPLAAMTKPTPIRSAGPAAPADPGLSELLESYRRHQQREGVSFKTLEVLSGY